MMKTNILALLAVGTVFLSRDTVLATASPEFLRLGVGARAAGLGSAYSALADDTSALHWNPAGLALLGKKELGLMHSEWLQGSKHDFVGYGHPFHIATVGVGITRLGEGKIEGRGEARESQGSFSAADTALTLGVGKTMRSGLSLGANAKYISSSIGQDRASSVAMDLGVLKTLARGKFSLGGAVRNLGPGMKFIRQRDPLPLAVALGGAYRLNGSLVFSLDVSHEPYDQLTTLGFGTEYTVLSRFSLRAGYGSGSFSLSRRSSWALEGFGGGFGLKIGNASADYAVTPLGGLGVVHRASVSVRFDRPGPLLAREGLSHIPEQAQKTSEPIPDAAMKSPLAGAQAIGHPKSSLTVLDSPIPQVNVTQETVVSVNTLKDSSPKSRSARESNLPGDSVPALGRASEGKRFIKQARSKSEQSAGVHIESLAASNSKNQDRQSTTVIQSAKEPRPRLPGMKHLVWYLAAAVVGGAIYFLKKLLAGGRRSS